MALDKMKTDSDLGKQIHNELLLRGVETPFSNNMVDPHITFNNRINLIKDNFAEIMKLLGLELSDDSLKETPNRVAKMFVNEIFWGLDYNNFPKITTVDNKMKYDEMIIERNISVNSNCEHHFVIIDGMATIAYIPDEKVLGLSKMNRIVEFFSKRPQIQERLTEQIYYAMSYILDTKNIAVYINAKHYCVKARGVEDANSNTSTTKLGGVFKESEVRNEFLMML